MKWVARIAIVLSAAICATAAYLTISKINNFTEVTDKIKTDIKNADI
jgi:pyruvate-formate lyase-activating enzyme